MKAFCLVQQTSVSLISVTDIAMLVFGAFIGYAIQRFASHMQAPFSVRHTGIERRGGSSFRK
jgi:hypothetical protein